MAEGDQSDPGGAAGDPAPRWAVAAGGAVVVAVVLACYLNSFQGSFILDDHSSIVDNWRIRRLTPLSKFLRRSRPLVNFSFALNYRWGRLKTRGYHAVNLAVHVAAALLLLGIVRRTLRADRLRGRFGRAALPLAAAVAGIWAVHPLQTGAVTYIVQRGESMTSLLYLLTLYCAIRSAEAPSRRRWVAAAVAACAAGMTAKEIFITAPVAVLLYDRTFLAGSFREALRRRWPLHAALAATWVVMAGLLLSRPASQSVAFATEQVSPAAYMRTQPGVILHYLRLAFWPAPLVFDYGWPEAKTFWQVLPPSAGVAALLAASVWALWRRPAAGFCGAWLFVVLAPTSSVVPLLNMAFEHRMYLPLAGVVALAVAGAFLLGRRALAGLGPRAAAAVGLAAAVAVTGVLGVLTVLRNRDYRSEVVMWRDVTAKRPGNPRGFVNLGQAYERRGNLPQAVANYRRAIEVDSNDYQALSNLGGVWIKQGRLDEAMSCFRRALAAEGRCLDAHNNLGVVLLARGETDRAIESFRRAVAIHPQYVEARLNLGLALTREGRGGEALRHLAQACHLRPDRPDAFCALGAALAAQGRSEEAIGSFRRALAMNPRYVEAHDGLAVELMRRGELTDAAQHLQRALALRPRWHRGHHHWGILLAAAGRHGQAAEHLRRAARSRPGDPTLARTLAWVLATAPEAGARSGREALRLAERAARADRDDPLALDALAAAHAELGSFEKAVASAARAAELAGRAGRSDLAGQIDARLALYRAGRPYRDRGAPADRLARLLPPVPAGAGASAPAR